MEKKTTKQTELQFKRQHYLTWESCDVKSLYVNILMDLFYLRIYPLLN